jgi:hypothetical protein
MYIWLIYSTSTYNDTLIATVVSTYQTLGKALNKLQQLDDHDVSIAYHRFRRPNHIGGLCSMCHDRCESPMSIDCSCDSNCSCEGDCYSYNYPESYIEDESMLKDEGEHYVAVRQRIL